MSRRIAGRDRPGAAARRLESPEPALAGQDEPESEAVAESPTPASAEPGGAVELGEGPRWEPV